MDPLPKEYDINRSELEIICRYLNSREPGDQFTKPCLERFYNNERERGWTNSCTVNCIKQQKTNLDCTLTL